MRSRVRSLREIKQTNKQTKRHLYRQSCSVDRALFFPKENDKGRGFLFNFQRADSGSNPERKRSSVSTVKLKTKSYGLMLKVCCQMICSTLFTIREPGPSFLKQDQSQTGLKAIHRMLANTFGTNTLNMKSERDEKRSPIKALCKTGCACCF